MNSIHQCTNIAKNTLITKPIQKDRQKSHMSISWRRSQGAFTCNHSQIPHFSMSVRKNFTERHTKNTHKTNSSMVYSSYP